MGEEKEEFTIRQIVIIALEKYKIIRKNTVQSSIESLIDTVRKKVSKAIEENEIESIGKAKSTPTSRRPAQTYSKESKDFIVDEYLFDYLINMTNDEYVKNLKSPKYYEREAQEFNDNYADETINFLNLSIEQKNALLYSKKNTEHLTKFSKEVHQRKREIMLEALFSKYYSFNLNELVEDFNKVNAVSNYKTGDYDKDDIKLFERFDDWNSYVEEK